MAEAHIGTSGWSYPGWKDGFFKGVPRRHWLRHCAERFTGLEINGSFYGGIKAETYRRWMAETPDSFRFAVKGHRVITHMRRLKGVGDAIALQRDNVAPLGARLSAMLWQTRDDQAKDLERLDGFLAELDAWPEVRHVIEFRHPSWFDDETAARLSAHRVASAISDAADWPRWDAVTSDLAYLRLHGHTRTYASAYAPRSLRRWAERLRAWLRRGVVVHAYFDNDAEGAAPRDAERLIELTGIRRA